MVVLSQQFLQSLGINLDEQTRRAFDEHFEATLEDRVIESVLDELNEQQLTELAALRDKSGEELQAWLQANIPSLSEIIQDEVDILLGDLAENSENI